MFQFILAEMEYRYPQRALVTIEEEPWIFHRIEISYYMQFTGRSVALGAHDGNLVPLLCHINNYQCVPHALCLSSYPFSC